MYGLTFLSLSEYQKCIKLFSEMQNIGKLTLDDYCTIKKIYKHFLDNTLKIKSLDLLQPRFIAQKFIGKNNIREFIFKRDGYLCLSCGSSAKLEIDHIIPISIGGENKISNLQTLCKSCNCSKKNNYKDYRNGN